MINLELMTKLYMVVAHNLNEARKARDGNTKYRKTTEPEKLNIGDNILVRDHTSKAFQPKYKDFGIVGLLGKNQIVTKDNHGHITKVHCRDVKRIPMTEKVCQLYEEEQIGKVREGRKTVPSNKMPDLGWDIAETQLHKESEQVKDIANPEIDFPRTALPLQAVIAIAILITTIMKHVKAYIQEIPEITRKTTQVLKEMTRKMSRSKPIQNIKEYYRTAKLAITIATRMTDRTSRINQRQTGISKKLQARENSVTNTIDRTNRIHPGPTAIVTSIKISCKPVSKCFTQRPNRTQKHPNTKLQITP